MDAIIMCAGLGTRLRPLTNTVPKPLIPIHGKGSLVRTLEALPPEVLRIILVVNYLEEKIKEAIGSTWGGRPVIYVHQEPLDGTGGCLRQVKEQVSDLSERFLVMYGDDLYAAKDIAALLPYPRALLGIEYVAGGNDTKDAWKVDENRNILSLYRPEKGENVWMNPGVYCLDHTWFETDPILTPGKTDEYSLPHAIQQMIAQGHDITVVPATFWMPVGTPEELQKAEEALSAE
jgi:UDP-N-acetylglucosamine diphosphorylase / glucose-1-phosphate thymidylyltransferase / UDP-N-acetylgalactosamine diphosphorylase / glucosamine-1-phosphate N-acetyltransferase / galactosamine-1-phosphate N-acetyltransferase